MAQRFGEAITATVTDSAGLTTSATCSITVGTLTGLAQLSCAAEPVPRSDGAPNYTPAGVIFVNQTSQTVDVYWINYSGQRVLYFILSPGQSTGVGTYPTHPWVVTSTSGACLTIFLPATSGGTAIIG